MSTVKEMEKIKEFSEEEQKKLGEFLTKILNRKVNIYKARKKFQKGLKELGRERKFIRGLVSSFKPRFVKQFDLRIPTICVMMTPRRRFKMLVNPAFIDSIKETEHVSGVLNHEINHVMRGHLTIDKTGLDEEVLTLTLEIHANEYIPKAWLPPQTEDGEALTHEKFNIPHDLMWQEIYEILIKKYGKKGERSEQQQKELDKTGVGKSIEGKGTAHRPMEIISKNKLTPEEQAMLTDAQMIKGALAETINKLISKMIRDQIEQDKEILEDKDFNEFHDYELSDEERKSLKETAQHTPGLLPGFLRIMGIDGDSKISWKDHLRNFVASMKKRKSSYYKMNKRFPKLMGIVPGRDYRNSKVCLLVLIDMSGSCMSFTQDFAAEVYKLSLEAEGVVIDVDTRIIDEYDLRDIKKKIKSGNWQGYGGTDFKSALADSQLNRLRNKFKKRKFDGLICLTDNYVYWPDKISIKSAMSFYPPETSNDFPFGRSVEIKDI